MQSYEDRLKLDQQKIFMILLAQTLRNLDHSAKEEYLNMQKQYRETITCLLSRSQVFDQFTK